MKRKKLKAKKKNHIYLLSFIIFVGILLSGIFLHISFQKSSGAEQPSRYIIVYPKPDGGKKTLQLQTFTIITLPPAPPSTAPVPSLPSGGLPADACPVDGIRPSGSTCKCIDNNAIACPVSGSNCKSPAFEMPFPPGSNTKYCVTVLGSGLLEPIPTAPPGCVTACIAKPVIYLYPTEPTLVDVSVRAPGKVFISDPLYPDGGWKNVLAYPDGTLSYQGKIYKELFYETEVTEKISMPLTGIVIKTSDIEKELKIITTKLGLIKHEQKEFLDFWVPVVKNMGTPYVFFSILPPDQKDALDHVDISPVPDTRIEFIAYFKALQKPIAVQPLALPDTPPARIGFTEVEWGGTIGY